LGFLLKADLQKPSNTSAGKSFCAFRALGQDSISPGFAHRIGAAAVAQTGESGNSEVFRFHVTGRHNIVNTQG
jgi:hypothetical protein